MAASLPEWSTESSPLQLIEFEEGTKAAGGGVRLKVNDAARKSLSKSVGDRPAKVVAVCGLYRTGKSLLLNLLAGTQGSANSFTVGDSIRACTAGIWARVSKPFGADGSVCLLLDCEGAGNTERDRDHDARLFALTVLLSSYLVFNSRGTIDERAVQSLAVAASLAQHIHKQHKEKAPGQDMTPAFLWTLRDFALALEDEAGNPITENEYLERVLRDPGTGGPPGADAGSRRADLREAREKITDLFPKRDCMCLVRPVEEEEQLQRLSELPLGEFRPKFISQIENLRRKVLGGCEVLKSPSGKTASIGTFIALVEAHVEAMNTGAVPELGSVWACVSQQECGRAVDEALRAFSAQLLEVSASLPANEDELAAMVKRGEEVAREKFKLLAIGDGAALADAEAELANGFMQSKGRIEKENVEVAMRANEACLMRIRSQHQEQIDSKLKDCRDKHDAGSLSTAAIAEAEKFFEGIISQMRSAYTSEAVGPKSSREDAWEAAESKLKASMREVVSFKGRSAANAEAQASAERAAADERKKLEEEAGKLNAQVAKEVEESKNRAAKLQQDRREDDEGVQNWDAADRASADPSKVELRDKSDKAEDRPVDAKDDKGAQKKKKCCVLM